MMAALIIVAAPMGAFFFWEGRQAVDAEIRDQALYVAHELAELTAADIISENRSVLQKKMLPVFAAYADTQSGKALLYVILYNGRCDLITGRTATEIVDKGDSYFYTLPTTNNRVREEVALSCPTAQLRKPVFIINKSGVYDLTFPILKGSTQTGFIRVGISSERYENKFFGIIRKSSFALVAILLVGLAFSQIIAIGITKPILRLSDAVEHLSQQNWDEPLPVKGATEISKLSHAFNELALTLKQREASLAQGNRDLFILHSSGLDLMESLDRAALLAKIAARAEDLLRADTTMVSIVDPVDHVLKYLGVFGGKAKVIKDRDLPIEAGGIFNWLVSYGTPLLIAEAQTDFRLDGLQMKALGIRSMMTVPLWSSNTMTALLSVVNKKGGANFDKHDLRLFTVFANLASAALQNASLYSDLKQKMNELNSAQEQLVRTTKMAAIGELSANVAHEINNPLTSVLGYTTHLLKTLELPEAQRKILGTIEQETLRVRKIIRDLLDFARQRPSWMEPSDISLPLKETVALLQGIAAAASVEIREDYPSHTILVNMAHNEMKQVFINIANNALQAMPQGGTLQIKVDASFESEVVIAISDSGTGIAAEHLPRIFEPFFSTKENGDGTGLGLSISYRIVQNHGGRIVAESTGKNGTTFRVFLPRYRKFDGS